MAEYSFSEKNAMKIIKKRIFLRLPVLIIAGVVGLYFANIDSNGMLFRNRLSLFLVVLILAVLLIIGVRYGIILGVTILLREKYVLTDTTVEKVTFSGKSIKIYLDKVETSSTNNKGLLLTSNSDRIFIPVEIDSYHEFTTTILANLR